MNVDPVAEDDPENEIVEPVETGEPPEATPAEEPAETPEGEPESSADDTGAPRKTGAEKRIGQLTRKYRQAERQNQALQGRLDALEKRVGPEPEPARPNVDDFDTTEGYEDALFEWRDSLSEHRTKEPEPQNTPDGWDDFSASVTRLAETIPDIEDVVFSDDYPCTDNMVEVLMASDRGAEIAYHLATHQAQAASIAGLSPMMAAREIGKIEAGLPETLKPSTSNAPDPVTPITPGGSGDADPDNMSANEWQAWRNKQVAGR